MVLKSIDLARGWVKLIAMLDLTLIKHIRQSDMDRVPPIDTMAPILSISHCRTLIP